MSRTVTFDVLFADGTRKAYTRKATTADPLAEIRAFVATRPYVRTPRAIAYDGHDVPLTAPKAPKAASKPRTRKAEPVQEPVREAPADGGFWGRVHAALATGRSKGAQAYKRAYADALKAGNAPSTARGKGFAAAKLADGAYVKRAMDGAKKAA